LNLPLKIALVLETYGINLINCKEEEVHLNGNILPVRWSFDDVGLIICSS